MTTENYVAGDRSCGGVAIMGIHHIEKSEGRRGIEEQKGRLVDPCAHVYTYRTVHAQAEIELLVYILRHACKYQTLYIR